MQRDKISRFFEQLPEVRRKKNERYKSKKKRSKILLKKKLGLSELSDFS
jgi:hypothetical protein